jgi:hypothetical protein
MEQVQERRHGQGGRERELGSQERAHGNWPGRGGRLEA